MPNTKKGLQSFFGTINFLRRFIPNLVEVTKPLNKLLRNNVKFQWDETGKRAFQQIKDACVQVLVLISLDYTKEFYLFSFASEDTIAGVLLHKNDQGQEQPIAYMSKILRDSELKYHMIEKQAYALGKSLKHFRIFIGYAKVIGYVPSTTIKDVLTQEEGLGPRGRWVAKFRNMI